MSEARGPKTAIGIRDRLRSVDDAVASARSTRLPLPPDVFGTWVSRQDARLRRGGQVDVEIVSCLLLMAVFGPRASDIASLRFQDVRRPADGDGFVVSVIAGKNRPYATVRTVRIRPAASRYRRWCPVEWLRRFLAIRGPSPGALFPALVPSSAAASVISDWIRSCVASVDRSMPLQPFSSHSMRKMCTVLLKLSGCDDEVVRQRIGWRDASMIRTYAAEMAETSLHSASPSFQYSSSSSSGLTDAVVAHIAWSSLRSTAAS